MTHAEQVDYCVLPVLLYALHSNIAYLKMYFSKCPSHWVEILD